MLEGADLRAVQRYLLFLRISQHQLGRPVRRKEVADVQFRNDFGVDRQAIRRADAAYRIRLVRRVEVDGTDANQP